MSFPSLLFTGVMVVVAGVVCSQEDTVAIVTIPEVAGYLTNPCHLLYQRHNNQDDNPDPLATFDPLVTYEQLQQVALTNIHFANVSLLAIQDILDNECNTPFTLNTLPPVPFITGVQQEGHPTKHRELVFLLGHLYFAINNTDSSTSFCTHRPTLFPTAQGLPAVVVAFELHSHLRIRAALLILQRRFGTPHDNSPADNQLSVVSTQKRFSRRKGVLKPSQWSHLGLLHQRSSTAFLVALKHYLTREYSSDHSFYTAPDSSNIHGASGYTDVHGLSNTLGSQNKFIDSSNSGSLDVSSSRNFDFQKDLECFNSSGGFHCFNRKKNTVN
nr:uncharacterized protein LOC128693889 [Cherax quadricarinatus]